MIELHGHPTHHASYSLPECCLNLRTGQIPFEDPRWSESVVLSGNAGVGKTQYALAHFENPLLISHIDKLKEFDPSFHDGLVFDDMDFSHWPLSAQKHLLDWSEPREINVKHSIAHIPARTKKIFTCNYGEFPFDMGNSAVMDRIYMIDTDRSLTSKRVKPPRHSPWGPLDTIRYADL